MAVKPGLQFGVSGGDVRKISQFLDYVGLLPMVYLLVLFVDRCRWPPMVYDDVRARPWLGSLVTVVGGLVGCSAAGQNASGIAHEINHHRYVARCLYAAYQTAGPAKFAAERSRASHARD